MKCYKTYIFLCKGGQKSTALQHPLFSSSTFFPMSIKSLLSNKSLCIQEAVNTIVSAAFHHLWVSRSEGTTMIREEDLCLKGDCLPAQL